MAKIKVELKDNSYEICIGSNILTELGQIVDKKGWGKDVFIITDPLVNKLYGGALRGGFKSKPKTIEIPRGERYKSLATAVKIYDSLLKQGAHRDSLIIALGGGVIGDLAGFAAATYMRGLNYIQVPTTLLAQVDAAIGGKTGVNHPRSKNLIGCFYQPKLVYSDLKAITSLPARELRTGLAEVVKYGVIADAKLFKLLEANAHHLSQGQAVRELWQTIVTAGAKIKARVVEKDEKESGRRMILNFGHTIGHAIESLTRYRAYNHGEAVAIGMVAAALIADKTIAARLSGLLEKLGLPVAIKDLPAKKITAALLLDKKVRGGKINLILPEKIGQVVIRDDVPVRVIQQILIELGAK